MREKVKAAAMCMQKNEGELIQAWVLHHSNIFGAENVFILDNLSTDELTCDVLQWASSCGVNVRFGFENFEYKGREIRRLINEHRQNYDWFLPLDADEFVGVYKNGRLSLDRSIVLGELGMMDPEKIIRMSHYVWSIPNSAMGYYTEARKVILPQAIDVPLDIGFHLYSWDAGSVGNTVSDDLFQSSSLAYAHIHNKPYNKLIESAKEKLANRVKSFSIDDLKEYSGAGRHLIQYFLKTESEYNSSFPVGSIKLTETFFDAGLAAPYSVARR